MWKVLLIVWWISSTTCTRNNNYAHSITHNMLENELTVWYGWHDYFFLQEDKEKWLAFQKKKWEFQSKQRAERKRLRKEADTMGISTLAVGRGPSTGLSTFMRQQARSLVDTPWQIIQVRFCNLDECGGRWACFSSMLLSPHCFTTAQAIILFIKCRHEIFIFILHFSLLRQMIQVHSKCGH